MQSLVSVSDSTDKNSNFEKSLQRNNEKSFEVDFDAVLYSHPHTKFDFTHTKLKAYNDSLGLLKPTYVDS